MEEKLKEGEHLATPAAASAEAPAPPPHGKKNRIRHLIMEMWPAYLIEVIVIILGITITLALEEWRDNNKESRLENIYQKNLFSDLNADNSSLRYAINGTQQILQKGGELISFINDPRQHPIAAGQATADLQKMLERPKFISSDATFSDLKNSGNLHLIKNIDLKNLLFTYYNLTQSIKEVQDAEQQATITISGPWFLKHVPMNTDGDKTVSIDEKTLQTLAGDIEFRNNILLRIDNRKELLLAYQKADSLASSLEKYFSYE